jgi:NADH-quinone oxidoreductase subunit F
MLASVEEGTGKMEYLDILKFQAKYMGPGNTFCAHAPGAAEPLQSGLDYFYDDFVRHIDDKKCPWR